MRAMNKSSMHFNRVVTWKNAEMLSSGEQLYTGFLTIMDKLESLDDSKYISLDELYNKLEIEAYAPLSKRHFYKQYKEGIVAGAGASEDCIDLIDNDAWLLFDLMDERMINKALGYTNKKGQFHLLDNRVGDTLALTDSKYIEDVIDIEVTTIDDLGFKPDLISIDVEGAALDVLTGANNTIMEHKPDLFVSIYHNWLEYLHVIPLLYDYGYTLHCVMNVNPIPEQPHLELCVFGEFK